MRSARRDALTYMIGVACQRASLLLILPLLLKHLTVTEYGTFGLLQSILNLLPPLLALNLPASITRLYFDRANAVEREARGASLMLLVLVTVAVLTMAGLAVVRFFNPQIAAALGTPARSTPVLAALVMLGALASSLLQASYGLWRARGQALRAATSAFAATALFLALGVMLASLNRITLQTILASYSVSLAAAGAVGVAMSPVWSRGCGIITKALVRDAYSYALPLLPYLVGLWLLASGGRWIGRATLSLEQVALFTLGTQLATAISLLGRAAFEAWIPRAFEFFASGELRAGYRLLRNYGLMALAASLLVASGLTASVAVLVPRYAPAYQPVVQLFPLMALASLADIAYMIPHGVLMGLKRTRTIGTYTMVTVAFFIACGTATTNWYGLWGLTGSYVMAYVLQLALASLAARRAYWSSPRSVDG